MYQYKFVSAFFIISLAFLFFFFEFLMSIQYTISVDSIGFTMLYLFLNGVCVYF